MIESMMAQLIIVSDTTSRTVVDAGTTFERIERVWELTMNVGGRSFTISETRAPDIGAAADVFAGTLRKLFEVEQTNTTKGATD